MSIKIAVDEKALREVLLALVTDGPQLREFMVLRNSSLTSLRESNPINILIADYEAYKIVKDLQ